MNSGDGLSPQPGTRLDTSNSHNDRVIAVTRSNSSVDAQSSQAHAERSASPAASPAATSSDYWRGRVDGHLENLSHRLLALELGIEIRHKENTTRLDHVHVCIEKRSKVLYIFSGGLAILYVLLQLVGPIIVSTVIK
jgi:hypothetical protein